MRQWFYRIRELVSDSWPSLAIAAFDNWPLLAIAAFGAFGIWAITSAYEEAAVYTKACNAKGGVALHADSPSRRQCLLNVATPLILEVK